MRKTKKFNRIKKFFVLRNDSLYADSRNFRHYNASVSTVLETIFRILMNFHFSLLTVQLNTRSGMKGQYFWWIQFSVQFNLKWIRFWKNQIHFLIFGIHYQLEDTTIVYYGFFHFSSESTSYFVTFQWRKRYSINIKRKISSTEYEKWMNEWMNSRSNCNCIVVGIPSPSHTQQCTRGAQLRCGSRKITG